MILPGPTIPPRRPPAWPPSSRLRRLLRVAHRAALRRRRDAYFASRPKWTVQYAASDDLVVDDPPNWRPARKGLDVVDILLSAKAAPHLSESPAALADLLARWNEMPAAFWPQRG